MEISFYWQTVTDGTRCTKADFLRITDSKDSLSIPNAHTASVVIDDDLVAVVYELPHFAGTH